MAGTFPFLSPPSFSNFSLTAMTNDYNLKEALKFHFGFDTFKDSQESVIRSLLDRKNVFVLMPTGGGKSLCYQLPALLMDGVAIVISPLIALMKNQVDAIRTNGEDDSIAHFLNSSLLKAQVEKVKADILEGRTKLLYVAPESLIKSEYSEFLKTVRISFYAVDEAHCISEWGHDFRPEYRRIRDMIREIGEAPVIALTATATEKVRADIIKCLGIKGAVEYKSSFNRPNLYYEVRQKTPNIDREIVKFIRQHPHVSGIIYCLSRKKVEELSLMLSVNGIKAAPYHAGLDVAVRSQTQDDFLMERIDVIVATIAFGMGIDKPDVRFVLHYDIPKSLEGYYQETGRAGRDGGEGNCIAFYSNNDLKKLEKFMESKPVNEQDIGRQLLKETASYAESAVCRRKLLLHYFGETYRRNNCGNCDNCNNPKEQVEGKEHLCKLLRAIVQVKEDFRDDYIKKILMGDATDEVTARHHDALDVFGIADDSEDDSLWNAVIRQALIAGYVKKDVENYGVLKLTAAGKKYLKHPASFKIVENNDFEEMPEEAPLQSGAAALDPELFQVLKDYRRRVAREKGVPTYVVFQDTSLEAMATVYPQSIEELQNIPGVGSGKARRYGKEFCEIIRKHCESKAIVRPEDIPIRNVPKKSQLKVSIINAIDRRVDLDELASMKNMEFDELLDVIYSIVNSGIKLNIDYFIEEVMDEDVVDEIYEYFKNSETDSLEVAFRELGSDCEEDEIRLVRIKFLSEMGN